MEFNEILSHFKIEGKFISCEPYGSGLINRTYVAVFDENGKRMRYIVQRINSNLFTNVDGLMNNIKLVTEFNRAEIIKRGGNPDRESLTLVYTTEGKPYFKAAENEYYRVYIFIEGLRRGRKARTFLRKRGCVRQVRHASRQIRQYATFRGSSELP